MQDGIGIRFGKPETDPGFVLPELPKSENIRVIHCIRFRILYPIITYSHEARAVDDYS
jgi:hypothetical protein